VSDLTIIQMPPSEITVQSLEPATCNKKSTKTDQSLVESMLPKSLIIMVVSSITLPPENKLTTSSPLLDGDPMKKPINNIGLLETHGVNIGEN